jgi:hypothetical protein
VLDTALYRDALARFEHRRRFPKERKQPIAPPATLRPGEYRIDQLPARAGFNAFEPAPRLSWLSKGARARLHFLVGDEPVSGFSIRIYTGAHDYPVQNASFLVNGASPPLDWRAGGDNWGTAFVGPFKPSHGLNTLEIHTAERDTTASAPALDPRSLTFGVSTIQVK